MLHLRPERVLTVNYVMGIVPLPKGFTRLRALELGRNEIIVLSASGLRVCHPVNLTSFETNNNEAF